MTRRTAALAIALALAAFCAPFSFWETDALALTDGPFTLLSGMLAEKGLTPYLAYYLLVALLRGIGLGGSPALALARLVPLLGLLAAFRRARTAPRHDRTAASFAAFPLTLAILLHRLDPRILPGAALLSAAGLAPPGPLRLAAALPGLLLAPAVALGALLLHLALFVVAPLLPRAERAIRLRIGRDLLRGIHAIGHGLVRVARWLPTRTPLRRPARALGLGLVRATRLLPDRSASPRLTRAAIELGAGLDERFDALATRLAGPLAPPRRPPAAALLLPAALLAFAAFHLTGDLANGERSAWRYFHSAGPSARPLAERLADAARDPDPPLYFALIALAGEVLPATPAGLRFPSLLATAGGIAALFLLARNRFGSTRIALFAATLLTLHPVTGQLATVGRMHGLAFLLTALMLLFSEPGRTGRARPNLALLSALLLTWTHVAGLAVALAWLAVGTFTGRPKAHPAMRVLFAIAWIDFAFLCLVKGTAATVGMAAGGVTDLAANGFAQAAAAALAGLCGAADPRPAVLGWPALATAGVILSLALGALPRDRRGRAGLALVVLALAQLALFSPLFLEPLEPLQLGLLLGPFWLSLLPALADGRRSPTGKALLAAFLLLAVGLPARGGVAVLALGLAALAHPAYRAALRRRAVPAGPSVI